MPKKLEKGEQIVTGFQNNFDDSFVERKFKHQTVSITMLLFCQFFDLLKSMIQNDLCI